MAKIKSSNQMVVDANLDIRTHKLINVANGTLLAALDLYDGVNKSHLTEAIEDITVNGAKNYIKKLTWRAKTGSTQKYFGLAGLTVADALGSKKLVQPATVTEDTNADNPAKTISASAFNVYLNGLKLYTTPSRPVLSATAFRAMTLVEQEAEFKEDEDYLVLCEKANAEDPESPIVFCIQLPTAPTTGTQPYSILEVEVLHHSSLY